MERRSIANSVLNLHQMVASIDAALASPQNRWEQIEDIAPPTLHFTGKGHPHWIFQLLVSPTHGAMGTALNVREGVVVKLTEPQTARAHALAKGAK